MEDDYSSLNTSIAKMTLNIFYIVSRILQYIRITKQILPTAQTTIYQRGEKTFKRFANLGIT